MDTNKILYKLNKYKYKLQNQPNNIIYQYKQKYYKNLIGSGNNMWTKEKKYFNYFQPFDRINFKVYIDEKDQTKNNIIITHKIYGSNVTIKILINDILYEELYNGNKYSKIKQITLTRGLTPIINYDSYITYNNYQHQKDKLEKGEQMNIDDINPNISRIIKKKELPDNVKKIFFPDDIKK